MELISGSWLACSESNSFFQAKENFYFYFLLQENSEIPPQLEQPESRPISRIAKNLDKICQLSMVGIVVYGSQGGGGGGGWGRIQLQHIINRLVSIICDL
jgi:hypothetical protein